MSPRPSKDAYDRLARLVNEPVLKEVAALREELSALRAEIAQATPAPRRMVSPLVLADELGVSRSFVYAHQDELGVEPLGSGRKPRLRFDVDRARRRLQSIGAGDRSESK